MIRFDSLQQGDAYWARVQDIMDRFHRVAWRRLHLSRGRAWRRVLDGILEDGRAFSDRHARTDRDELA